MSAWLVGKMRSATDREQRTMQRLRRKRVKRQGLRKRAGRRCAGLTMIEAVISMLIVSIMFAAALNTLGGARMMQHRTTDRIRASQLAHAWLTNAVAMSYEEIDPSALTGPALPTGWQLDLDTQWVDADDGFASSNTDTGMMRVTVTIRRGDQPIATAVGLKATASD